MKQLLLSLVGVWLCIAPTFAQDGTQNDPFTTLSQANTAPSAGDYYFNIDGQRFRTYVDANGFVQIAYDNSNAKEALPLLTDLPQNTYGMLPPAVLATMGDLEELRISSSDPSKLDAVTPANDSLVKRIVTFKSLMTGISDNAHNEGWVGTNSEFLRRDARATRAPQPLNQEIFHVNNNINSEGVHWIPLRGDRSLSYINTVPVAEAWTLWVRVAGATQPTDPDPGSSGPEPTGPGSATDPFTNLSDATGVTSAGVYYFDLNGVTFSTYVDQQGFVQVALEFGSDANGDLPQSTSLTANQRGILTPAALAVLTDMTEVRMSSSVLSNLDARTTDPGIFNKILTNDALMTDSADNAINQAWTGTGSQYLIGDSDRRQTQSANLDRPLNQEIYHSYYGSGMHWIPYRGDQALVYQQNVPSSEKYTLWVRAVEQGLPLLLHSFKAFSEGHSVRIDWSVLAANGADHIDIERSVDGKVWTAIDRYDVLQRAVPLDRTFWDTDPPAGTVYYRLRQTDHDGTVDVSHVVAVAVKRETSRPLVYPNPTAGRVTVSGNFSTDEPIEIIDALGRRVTASVSVVNSGEGHLTVDLASLASGIYYIRVGTRTQQVNRL